MDQDATERDDLIEVEDDEAGDDVGRGEETAVAMMQSRSGVGDGMMGWWRRGAIEQVEEVRCGRGEGEMQVSMRGSKMVQNKRGKDGTECQQTCPVSRPNRIGSRATPARGTLAPTTRGEDTAKTGGTRICARRSSSVTSRRQRGDRIHPPRSVRTSPTTSPSVGFCPSFLPSD